MNHQYDCERIQSIAARKLCVIITLEQAKDAWEEHSEMLAAGWLNIDDEKEVADAVEAYLQKGLKKLLSVLFPENES